jgi:excisionase family DNA binding protein
VTRVNRVAGRGRSRHPGARMGPRADEAGPSGTAPEPLRARSARSRTVDPMSAPGSSADDPGALIGNRALAGRTIRLLDIEEPEHVDVHPEQPASLANDTAHPIKVGPTIGALAGLERQILLTPEQAGALLAVPGSWLRVKAAAGQIPSRRLGKHLRFTRSDLDAIADAAARPIRQPQPTATPTRATLVNRQGPRRRVS